MPVMETRDEEGRDKLRKAVGRSKYPVIHGLPNGETRHVEDMSYCGKSNSHSKGTRGTETSKYPEEEKETSIS